MFLDRFAVTEALLRHTGREWQGFDPTTLKRFGEAGLEPDKFFYIERRQAILGKERIDLASDPPPDLAIEVDATSTTSAEDYGMVQKWGLAPRTDRFAGL